MAHPRTDHRHMRSPARRPLLVALLAVLAIGLVPAASVSAATSSGAISAAERTALTLTNARRANAGLVPLRADTRLFALARDRARYMAETEEFSHTQSGGTSVFDLMTAQGIRWYAGGEIIAWNTAAALDFSADFAVKGWMGSPSHKSIMLSKGYNYVGFGLAISPTSGKRYWAGVYMKGPDRTGAWAKVGSVTTTNLTSTSFKATITWAGKDTRLQVLTSGLRHYQVQRRANDGAWLNYGTTTATSMTKTWSRGVTYEFRVRARDKAGNWGSWNSVIVTSKLDQVRQTLLVRP
jgi:uncharacterized protein YkwD